MEVHIEGFISLRDNTKNRDRLKDYKIFCKEKCIKAEIENCIDFDEKRFYHIDFSGVVEYETYCEYQLILRSMHRGGCNYEIKSWR